MKYIYPVLVSVFLLGIVPAMASERLKEPEKGILCDRYMCADKGGVSVDMTRKHLGDTAANAIIVQGAFDPTRFTFANGLFCDAKERACHVDRYFDVKGKRSAIDPESTARLFGS